MEEEQKEEKPDFREGLHKHEDKPEAEEDAEEGGEEEVSVSTVFVQSDRSYSRIRVQYFYIGWRAPTEMLLLCEAGDEGGGGGGRSRGLFVESRCAVLVARVHDHDSVTAIIYFFYSCFLEKLKMAVSVINPTAVSCCCDSVI